MDPMGIACELVWCRTLRYFEHVQKVSQAGSGLKSFFFPSNIVFIFSIKFSNSPLSLTRAQAPQEFSSRIRPNLPRIRQRGPNHAHPEHVIPHFSRVQPPASQARKGDILTRTSHAGSLAPDQKFCPVEQNLLMRKRDGVREPYAGFRAVFFYGACVLFCDPPRPKFLLCL